MFGRTGGILVLAVGLWVGGTAWAGDYYLGGGLKTTSFGGDLWRGNLVDLHAGGGVSALVGFSLTPSLAIEGSFTHTWLKEHFADRNALYQVVEAGPRYTPWPDWEFAPFVFGGVGRYDLDILGTRLKGNGAYAGIGVEQFAGKVHAVRLTVQGTRWKTDPYDLDASNVNFTVIYTYHFGR